MNGIQEKKRSECVQDVTVLTGTKGEEPFRKRKRRDFYVYAWLDPRKSGKFVYGEYEFDYEPFYIGKGKGKRSHVFKKRNTHVNNKIKKIETPICVLIKKDLQEKEAFSEEIKCINTIGRIDLHNGVLCNLTNGGGDFSGWVPSEKTRALWSFQRKGENNYWFGKKFSEEMRKNMSLAQTGRIIKKEHRERIAEANTGKTHSEETKKKMSVAQKNRYKTKPSPLKGRKHSVKTKNKMSESQKKAHKTRVTVVTNETKEKLSLSLRGNKNASGKRTEESIKNIKEGKRLAREQRKEKSNE